MTVVAPWFAKVAMSNVRGREEVEDGFIPRAVRSLAWETEPLNASVKPEV